MGRTNMEYYRKLLSSIHETAKDDVSSYMSLSEYNIFNVLEVTEKEVVMCRFLSDLLNPEGQHGYGILFLKSFLQYVLEKEQINDTLIAHTNVVKEYGIDDERRIDIAIYNIRFFIPMEVKIYAGEQESQCYDYYTYAKSSTLLSLLINLLLYIKIERIDWFLYALTLFYLFSCNYGNDCLNKQKSYALYNTHLSHPYYTTKLQNVIAKKLWHQKIPANQSKTVERILQFN